MTRLALPVLLLTFAPVFAVAADPPEPIARFRTQEFEKGLKIGYAVTVADLNGDGKPDIIVVDKHRVVWYENPSWKMRTILTGTTKPDNVCICTLDIDGDGQLDTVIGADWAPFNTKGGGTLQWLKRGKTLDDEWTMHPIAEEPTVHRVRTADIDGSGKPAIVLAPLMGRDSSAKNNWMDGRPVRILAFPIPKDPVKGPWKPVVLNESLHVVHNIWPEPRGKGKSDMILCASYEGVTVLGPLWGKWSSWLIGAGNQANPNSNRGASEIKVGKQKNGRHYIATIEPWHGNQVVVYTEDQDEKGMLNRFVIDEELRWGHGLWCADLDGDGVDEIIVGVRDNPKPGDPFKTKCGVRVYKCTDGKGANNLIVKRGGIRQPIGTEPLVETTDNSGNVRSEANLYMNGPAILEFTIRRIPAVFKELLARAEVTLNDVRWVVMHQANEYMLRYLQKKIGIPDEKFAVHLADCGNTVSSTIPIALQHLVKEGQIMRDDLILTLGFGVGYSWGANLIRWSPDA